jgi:hypothetical protein
MIGEDETGSERSANSQPLAMPALHLIQLILIAIRTNNLRRIPTPDGSVLVAHQPLSISRNIGLNAAAGIWAMTLEARPKQADPKQRLNKLLAKDSQTSADKWILLLRSANGGALLIHRERQAAARSGINQ